MDSALAGYLSSDEETPHHGPLGEVVSGDSILLPPELVFLGDPLGCLTCYASSEEDQTDRGAPAASAAVPLLPTPSFSFPSQPAASSFPFANDPAPAPCRHAPVHPATSPSEVSQAPVPAAGFAPVLPSASPREALPKAPVPAGSAPVRPSASPQEALPKAPVPSGSAPVRPSAPLVGAFPLAPVPGGCAPVHPAVPPVAVSFHGHISGTQTPAPCARPLTGPCPASDHVFPSASGLSEDPASSASLFAHLPAALRVARPVWSRSLQVRATFLPQPSPWVFSQ